MFTKKNLKTGMRCYTKNGDVYIVMLNCEYRHSNILVEIDGTYVVDLQDYNDDLSYKYNEEKDIIKVTIPMHSRNVLKKNIFSQTVIYENKEEYKYTDDEKDIINKLIDNKFYYIKCNGENSFKAYDHVLYFTGEYDVYGKSIDFTFDGFNNIINGETLNLSDIKLNY